MSFAEYQRLGQSAAEAYNNGQHRLAADNYLAALSHCTDKWEMNRWQIFRGYTSILQEKYFTPTQADLDALERFVNDHSEVKHVRVEAAFTRGLLHWNAKERDEAADMYREAIRIGEKLKPSQRRQRILATLVQDNRVTGLGMRPVGDIVDEIVMQAKSNLEKLSNQNLYDSLDPTSFPTPPPVQMRSDGTPMPQDVRKSGVAIGPGGTSLTREEMAKLLSVGGDSCDCCQKTRQELGRAHLNACARCKRAYYCSRECQTAQWRAGHKEHCRKPGVIKPGDYRKVQEIQRRPEINGLVVQVLGPDPNKEGRWETRIPGGDRSISLATKNLYQLRPLK